VYGYHGGEWPAVDPEREQQYIREYAEQFGEISARHRHLARYPRLPVPREPE
jgi:hypothetical protein